MTIEHDVHDIKKQT